MKRLLPLIFALTLALSLCACAPKAPDAQPDAPSYAEKTPTQTPAAEPLPAAPDRETPEEPTIPDGVFEQDGAARYYLGGVPVEETGLARLDGALFYFRADGTLFYFETGVNDCEGTLFYHTGAAGYALETPEGGLFDDGAALYFVQEDGSLRTDGAAGYLSFGADGKYTSGSAEIDAAVELLLQQSCEEKDAEAMRRLEAVFDCLRDNYRYLSMAHYEAGTDDWAAGAAETFLRQGKGNCYGFAAAFMYCARRLGYQAYVVAGHEGRADNDHAWTMIDEADGTYLYDVQLEYAYLYQFQRGEVDAFRLSDSGNSVYNGFAYYFP